MLLIFMIVAEQKRNFFCPFPACLQVCKAEAVRMVSATARFDLRRQNFD